MVSNILTRLAPYHKSQLAIWVKAKQILPSLFPWERCKVDRISRLTVGMCPSIHLGWMLPLVVSQSEIWNSLFSPIHLKIESP